MFPCCNTRTLLQLQSRNDRSFRIRLSSSPKLCNSTMQPIPPLKCVKRFGKVSGMNEGSWSVMNACKEPHIDGLRYSMEFRSNWCKNKNLFWSVRKCNYSNKVSRTWFDTFRCRLVDHTEFIVKNYVETIRKHVKNLEESVQEGSTNNASPVLD